MATNKSPVNPNIKILAVPLIYLVVLIALSIFVVRLGIDRIKIQRKNLATATKVENILKEKDSTLRDMQTQLPPLIKGVSSSIPGENPSLLVLSQVKMLTVEQPLGLIDLRIGGVGTGGKETAKVNLSFKANASFDEIYEYVSKTQELAPLMAVNRLEMDFVDDMVTSDVRLIAFWAPYPASIPAVTDAVKKLTTQEMEVLRILSTKRLPEFEDMQPTEPIDRYNPFF